MGSTVIAIDTRERTEDVLALGRLLVDATGTPARLVTVFASSLLGDADDPEMVELREQARGTLSELADAVGLAGAETEVVAGNFAARELQHISERPDTDLLVVGSTTSGPVGRLLIGGVGERLLSGAACPIAIAPRGYAGAAPERLTSIGVAVDGSQEAREALAGAIDLAARTGARLRVITAFQSLAFGAVATAAVPSASANDTMREGLQAVHDEALDAARERVEVESRLREGPADEVLLEESADVELLFTGSRGYGPLGAVLLGSATTALARGAACPIVVTPRGATPARGR